jgi:Zn-dependent protease/CBS domain-containing protein
MAHKFPLWDTTQRWGVAAVTSLLFFSSVLAHELAHSVVAVRKGIPVHGITLFIFGGVSRITREASRPGTELMVAIVGPLASLALGGIFLGVEYLANGRSEPLEALAWLLARANLALGIFNLVPGFPLDGGRVLRALVWAVTRSYQKATRVAVASGHIMAALMIVGGAATAFWFRDLSGLWLALVGWFLFSAASTARRQLRLQEALQGIRVRDVMSSDYALAPPSSSIAQAVEEHLRRPASQGILVGEPGAIYGMLDLRRAQKVPRARWATTPVETVVTPVGKARWLSPDDELMRALELLEEADQEFAPVLESGQLRGLVSREGVLRFVRLRQVMGG